MKHVTPIFGRRWAVAAGIIAVAVFTAVAAWLSSAPFAILGSEPGGHRCDANVGIIGSYSRSSSTPYTSIRYTGEVKTYQYLSSAALPTSAGATFQIYNDTAINCTWQIIGVTGGRFSRMPASQKGGQVLYKDWPWISDPDRVNVSPKIGVMHPGEHQHRPGRGQQAGIQRRDTGQAPGHNHI